MMLAKPSCRNPRSAIGIRQSSTEKKIGAEPSPCGITPAAGQTTELTIMQWIAPSGKDAVTAALTNA